MGFGGLNLNESPPEDDTVPYVMLERDKKPICRTRCLNLPFLPCYIQNTRKYQCYLVIRSLLAIITIEGYSWSLRNLTGTGPNEPSLSGSKALSLLKGIGCPPLPNMPQYTSIKMSTRPMLWKILDFQPKAKYIKLDLPFCQLHPEPLRSSQRREWGIFTDWMRIHEMVGIVRFKSYEFYILPPHQGQELPLVDVCYQMKNGGQGVRTSGGIPIEPKSLLCASPRTKNTEVPKHNDNSHANNYTKRAADSLPCDSVGDSTSQSRPAECLDSRGQKIHLNTNPSYLKTLGQAHGWTFGAIAELVDNSRDAGATRLDICVESLYLKGAGKLVPVLSIVDDGHGMSYNEMVRMLSLGHGQPDEDDPDHIGRFGVGFKTGAMKLGKDVIVLSQTSTSRSVALFSQSFNEDKDNMEIPIVSYRRHGNYMELDLNIQSETCANNYLTAIKDFSPFNEYFLGEKFHLFDKKGSGTQIYIWNLDEWGSNYTLQWDATKTSDSVQDHSDGDILIRSRRLRSRPGQISRKVPLDYSLKAYLEVIFLDPRMKIYVQGSLVKSRPLAKSLSTTVTVKGRVMGKPLQLTLGRSKEEWERVNCGIFLYWHGRLIETYKRVGGMVHNADMGRGVIGVVDVTNIMDDGKGHVWVMNTKQGFQDCEAYARLEEWLGNKADEYWDNNFDTLDLKKGNITGEPDHDWVQCDKCRKWRMLSTGFDTKSLPEEWFCYMAPFNGKCETPEQQMEPGVVTVSATRSRGNPQQVTIQCEKTEVPNCNSSPSGSNNLIAIQSSRCDTQQKPRNTATLDKGRHNVISVTNHKTATKGESSDSSWKVNIESPPRISLKRLRRSGR